MGNECKKIGVVAICLLAISFGQSAFGATVPFTEDFSTDAANWVDGASNPITWNASGGPGDSSFVSSTVNFVSLPDAGAAIAFRGKDSLDASGDAFVGDWISDGVDNIQYWVKHDAGFPLPFFVRLAPNAGFPGSNIIMFNTVPSDVWTLLNFSVDAMNPALILEGGTFDSNFANIGRFQIGPNVPTGMGGLDQVITVSLDQVSIVPEPTTLALIVSGLAVVGLRRRKRGV